MKISQGVNEHGVSTSEHVCRYCGTEYSTTPATPDEWGCMLKGCESYRADCDIDGMVEQGIPVLARHKDGHMIRIVADDE